MKVKTMTYWTSTAILTAGLFTGGLSQLGHQQDTTAAIQHLGYPLYFMTIIGTWKVLAVFALLVPGFARLKEWAYAGVFFNMTGAMISHLVCGDPAWRVVVALSFAVLAVVSWATRPASRTLGTLFSATAPHLRGLPLVTSRQRYSA
jgi:DoxX-like family